MTEKSPQIEQARLSAAQSLPPSCADDFQRLSKSLIYGPPFQWLLVDAPDEALRRQVMAALERVLRAARLGSSSLPLSDRIDDVAELERRLVEHARQQPVIHVIGRPGWFDAQRWDAFNVRRERIAAEVRARLVFWLDAEAIELASRGAPDLWAWRSGVYAFVPDMAVITSGVPLPASLEPVDRSLVLADMSERRARADEIRAWLATSPPMALRADPIRELGDLLRESGNEANEMAHWQAVALPYFDQVSDLEGRAYAMGKVAELLAQRGDSEGALALLRSEVLPLLEQAGKHHSRARALGQIANILLDQGRPGEALRIRREEQIPLLERLGAVRERALALGRVADLLTVQDRLFEALGVRGDEELTAYALMGDARGVALTNYKIAGLLAATGRVDEALSMYRELLPVLKELDEPWSPLVHEQMQALLKTRGAQR